MSFSFSSIAQYHQQLQQGSVSCTQAVEHYLHAIEKQQHLNAMVQVFADEARAAAQELDSLLQGHQAMLPLHGVVVSLKEVICYKGHTVSAASRMLQGFTSAYSATVVDRLLAAGAIIIGTTNCDEFAMGSTNEHSAFGPARNAADPNRVPGGSSGGSAVAVQAGLCMVSLGSDTGGSVRQPADFCGVVGFKPSYGRISRYGLIAYASSFDCIGIFASSVPDVAAVYNQIAGPDGKDSTAMPEPPEMVPTDFGLADTGKRYKLAVLEPTLTTEGLDPEIASQLRRSLEEWQKQGHTVSLLPFSLLDYIVPTYYVLTTAEASSNLGRYDGVRFGHRSAANGQDLTALYRQSRSQGFGPEVQRRILLGSFVLSAGYYDAYYTKAQQVRQLLAQQTNMIFNEFDAILMPVSPTTAPALGAHAQDPIAMYMADIYTVFANLAGLPGMALPLYKHSNGMPFGMQVLTNRGQEVLLHRLAETLYVSAASHASS